MFSAPFCVLLALMLLLQAPLCVFGQEGESFNARINIEFITTDDAETERRSGSRTGVLGGSDIPKRGALNRLLVPVDTTWTRVSETEIHVELRRPLAFNTFEWIQMTDKTTIDSLERGEAVLASEVKATPFTISEFIIQGTPEEIRMAMQLRPGSFYTNQENASLEGVQRFIDFAKTGGYSPQKALYQEGNKATPAHINRIANIELREFPWRSIPEAGLLVYQAADIIYKRKTEVGPKIASKKPLQDRPPFFLLLEQFLNDPNLILFPAKDPLIQAYREAVTTLLNATDKWGWGRYTEQQRAARASAKSEAAEAASRQAGTSNDIDSRALTAQETRQVDDFFERVKATMIADVEAVLDEEERERRQGTLIDGRGASNVFPLHLSCKRIYSAK